jgi:hypothetical protein
MTVTTFNADDVAPVPATALDYAAPPRPRPWTGSFRELSLGIAAAIFIAGGFGLLLFGALMALGLRDENAGLIAFGTSFMLLGAAFLGLLIWLRRNAR